MRPPWCQAIDPHAPTDGVGWWVAHTRTPEGERQAAAEWQASSWIQQLRDLAYWYLVGALMRLDEALL